MYVTLPKIMVSFSADVERVRWVISAFATAEAVMMPTIGRPSNAIGYHRLYIPVQRVAAGADEPLTPTGDRKRSATRQRNPGSSSSLTRSSASVRIVVCVGEE